MAIFQSVQSGNFDDPATWDLGAVPDLASDDVVVNPGHEVVIGANLDLSMSADRLLVVVGSGMLRIQGGLAITDSYVWASGTIISEGTHLTLGSAADLSIQPTGSLQVTTACYFEATATATIEGQFIVAAGGDVQVDFGAALTLEVGASWSNDGDVQCRGQVTIRDDFSIENAGTVTIDTNGLLEVTFDGALFVLGTLDVSSNGRIDLFGYFELDANGVLSVGAGGLIRVHQDIHLSGRMTGGGRIDMLRREGRILDGNGQSLIALDRAYGYSKTLVA